MIRIVRANEKDYQLLSTLAKRTLLESHAGSPAAAGLDNYVKENYSDEAVKDELGDIKNIYHIIYYNDRAAGYSKIIFDKPYTESELKNITKLDRFYVLKEFYDLKLGFGLFKFIVELSKRNNQAGLWLYTWKDNQRAIKFYKKNGFIITGSYDFKITETLSNPNHQMLLKFEL